MKIRRIKLGMIQLGTRWAIAVVFSMVLTISSFGGQVVDRVVANVNGHVVLQSDWEQEVAFEAFANGRDPESFTSAERHAALDRLIDQELLREQVRPSQPAPAEQVAARVAEVRKLHPDCATDDVWHATLQRYGLTQSALEKRLSDQIQLMKLVEDRLRPSIQIDQRAVETYYHDQLLPEMKKAGNSATPLTEVFGRIKSLLAEKKMNELLTGWLASLRSGSHIATPESSGGDQTR
jgi:peptidyl-prolyl cis-trans isomerase SurA